MASKIRSLWAWLAKNWEPVTSVSALVISAWSSVLAYQGIVLANRGVEIAQQAQRETNRAAVLARTPLFNIYKDPKSISVKNLGLGPGNIYQINASAGALQTIIDNPQPRQAAKELETFLRTWIAGIKDLPPDFKSQIAVANIMGLYNVGQENVLIKMKDGSDLPDQFYNEAKELVLTVCFSDLAADSGGSSTSGETDEEGLLACNAPRSIVNYVDRP